MSYFRRNRTADSGNRSDSPDPGQARPYSAETYMDSEDDTDDGFDELQDGEEEEQLTEEEMRQLRRKRFRVASGAGNLSAILLGTLIILVLLALLMGMINFVINDINRNFTLLQTRF